MAKTFEEKIDEAVEKADEAFWNSIVDSFPEVKSGDFPPEDTLAWKKGVRGAILTWLMYNYPTERERQAAWSMVTKLAKEYGA